MFISLQEQSKIKAQALEDWQDPSAVFQSLLSRWNQLEWYEISQKKYHQKNEMAARQREESNFQRIFQSVWDFTSDFAKWVIAEAPQAIANIPAAVVNWGEKIGNIFNYLDRKMFGLESSTPESLSQIDEKISWFWTKLKWDVFEATWADPEALWTQLGGIATDIGLTFLAPSASAATKWKALVKLGGKTIASWIPARIIQWLSTGLYEWAIYSSASEWEIDVKEMLVDWAITGWFAWVWWVLSKVSDKVFDGAIGMTKKSLREKAYRLFGKDAWEFIRESWYQYSKLDDIVKSADAGKNVTRQQLEDIVKNVDYVDWTEFKKLVKNAVKHGVDSPTNMVDYIFDVSRKSTKAPNLAVKDLIGDKKIMWTFAWGVDEKSIITNLKKYTNIDDVDKLVKESLEGGVFNESMLKEKIIGMIDDVKFKDTSDLWGWVLMNFQKWSAWHKKITKKIDTIIDWYIGDWPQNGKEILDTITRINWDQSIAALSKTKLPAKSVSSINREFKNFLQSYLDDAVDSAKDMGVKDLYKGYSKDALIKEIAEDVRLKSLFLQGMLATGLGGGIWLFSAYSEISNDLDFRWAARDLALWGMFGLVLSKASSPKGMLKISELLHSSWVPSKAIAATVWEIEPLVQDNE